MSDSRGIPVVVGLVWNASQQILIEKRPQHVPQGGFWGFPGGKVELSENLRAALRREMLEEVGLRVLDARLWMVLHDKDGGSDVVLYVFQIPRYFGNATSCEGQEIRWVNVYQCMNYGFPPLNQSIIDALA